MDQPSDGLQRVIHPRLRNEISPKGKLQMTIDQKSSGARAWCVDDKRKWLWHDLNLDVVLAGRLGNLIATPSTAALA